MRQKPEKFLGFHASDALVKRLTRIQMMLPILRQEMIRASRSETLRIVILAGIEHFEAQLKSSRK